MQGFVLKQQLMMEKISLITYVFGQSECFLRPRYMKIDSNQLINAGMSKGSWESEILILFFQLHGITGCGTTSYKFNTEQIHVLKVCKDASSLALIKT